MLSLFPSQVRIADANGFATPEFLRALQVVYTRIGGVFGDGGADVFSQLPQERDFPDVTAVPEPQIIAPDAAQPMQADAVWPDVMQPLGLWPIRLAASALVGRESASAGDPEQITLGSGLSMSGSVLSAQISGAATTFTPAVAGTSTAGVGTYATQQGKYINLSGAVLFVIYLDWSAHTGTGNIKITGLPVSSGAVAVGSCQIGLLNNYTLAANSVMTAYVGGASTEITIDQYVTGGGGASAVTLDTAATLAISGLYFT